MSVSVLVVDDDTSVTTMLAEILRAEGFNAEEAATGHEAIEKAKTGAFDAIVLDYMLPDMKGEEVCDMIRASDGDVAIILLSGLMSTMSESQLSKFDNVFLKPAHPLQVINAIRECVEKIPVAHK